MISKESLNMPVQILFFSFLLFATSSFARGPAVEDFVGIETEETSVNLHGAELLYNLEQDVSLIAQSEGTPKATSSQIQSPAWSTSAVFALVILLGFPLIIWSLAMNYFRRKAQEESVANIEVLQNYRKQKSITQETEESHRKVS